jgi:hypothetical protein
MMTKMKGLGSEILIAILTVFLILLFQNCTGPMSSSSPLQTGGTGTDGMRFFAYGTCQNNQIGVSATVVMDSHHQNAMIVRQNCQDLVTPQSISPSQISFATQDSSVFTFNGQVFDQQNGVSGQRVTTEFCQSPSSQALIWSTQGNSTALFGSVTLTDGPTTGTLIVQNPAANTPLDFTTSPSQSSQFDLSLASSSNGALTYAINGGNQISVQNMTCSNQPVLPASIFFRSKSAIYTSNNNSITITAPTAIQSGDVMITQVFGAFESLCPNTITAPTGWSQIRFDTITDVNCDEQYLFYKIATGTEPTNYTFTLQSTPNYIGQFGAAIVAYAGVKSTAPIDAHACNTGLPGTATAPSITTTHNYHALLFTIYQDPTHGRLPTTPPYLTQRIGDTDNSSYFNFVYDGTVSTPGPTGAIQESVASGDDWITCQLALTPGP